MEKLIPFIYPVCFIGFFVLVIFILSRLGWHQFTHKYAAKQRIIGKTLSFCSGRIGLVGYNSVLNIKYNDEGLCLHPELIFKLFHKALFIPWEDIQYTEESSLIFFTYANLSIGKPPIGNIKISARTFKEFQRYLVN